MTRLLLFLIQGYQRFLSPLMGQGCRFSPTCSCYAHDAIHRYGAWRGGFMALKRILKCHPGHPGGHDPVQ